MSSHILSAALFLLHVAAMMALASSATRHRAKWLAPAIRPAGCRPVCEGPFRTALSRGGVGGGRAMRPQAFVPARSKLYRWDELGPSIRQTFQSRRYNANRYDRFRNCLKSASEQSSELPPLTPIDVTQNGRRQIFNETDLLEVGKGAFEVLSSNRRSFNRTWKRMSPLMELIVRTHNRRCDISEGSDGRIAEKGAQSGRLRSIADVGCDHGMLSLSLACMASVEMQRRERNKENQCRESDGAELFTKVTGTDVSSQALAEGGLISLDKMADAMARMKKGSPGWDVHDDTSEVTLPVEFRLGCGLEPLEPGEADAVVLAGMGVHTMLEILFGNIESGSASDVAPVDRVKTTHLFLQPTNSRPQHMIILYDQLQNSAWTLKDEKVAYVGGRWYISTLFERGGYSVGGSKRFLLPGHFLKACDGEDYDAYVKHHMRWLETDFNRPKGMLEDEDIRWLKYITSSEDCAKWARLAHWFLQ
ncbi:hypothetical protein ACHAWF_014234 [Thalassiosira exigua]